MVSLSFIANTIKFLLSLNPFFVMQCFLGWLGSILYPKGISLEILNIYLVNIKYSMQIFVLIRTEMMTWYAASMP